MARKQKQDYDWLDDPFDDRKNQKPQGGCSGIALVALILAVVLVAVLGFVVVGSLGVLGDVYSG
ncbi:hypothetical protein [Raoultibacter massiliensis]|uniref:Uncharacterized protein n=1 Tax=Raoultibacter massiliensis TaxID=1852371 RepID=A0ABV1JBZ4_9ACTN|nr:hypothetical protein [Raoultibacter massiliensis]